MRSISSSQKENILSMASNGLQTHPIASRIGLGNSTVFRVLQDLLPHCPIPSAGCFTSSPLLVSTISFYKLPLEKFLVQFWPPHTSIPSSLMQSPHRQ
ncbi:hypothetical protein ID866_12926 [Astraeus odoratus]|nr:hypothetical protein ID866_12926 [Astraeus odoratus]